GGGGQEPAGVVGDGGKLAALRAAGQCDRDARQDTALRILDCPRNRRARRLRTCQGRKTREDESYEGETQCSREPLPPPQEGHRLLLFLSTTYRKARDTDYLFETRTNCPRREPFAQGIGRSYGAKKSSEIEFRLVFIGLSTAAAAPARRHAWDGSAGAVRAPRSPLSYDPRCNRSSRA